MKAQLNGPFDSDENQDEDHYWKTRTKIIKVPGITLDDDFPTTFFSEIQYLNCPSLSDASKSTEFNEILQDYSSSHDTLINEYEYELNRDGKKSLPIQDCNDTESKLHSRFLKDYTLLDISDVPFSELNNDELLKLNNLENGFHTFNRESNGSNLSTAHSSLTLVDNNNENENRKINDLNDNDFDNKYENKESIANESVDLYRKFPIVGLNVPPQIVIDGHPMSPKGIVVDAKRRVWLDRNPKRPYPGFFPPSSNVQTSTSNIEDYSRNFNYYFEPERKIRGKDISEVRYIDGKFRTDSFKIGKRGIKMSNKKSKSTKKEYLVTSMKRRVINNSDQNSHDKSNLNDKDSNYNTIHSTTEPSNRMEPKEVDGKDHPIWVKPNKSYPRIALYILILIMSLMSVSILILASLTLSEGFNRANIISYIINNSYIVLFLFIGIIGLIVGIVGITGLIISSKPILVIFSTLLWPLAAMCLAEGFLTYKVRDSKDFAITLNNQWNFLYDEYTLNNVSLDINTEDLVAYEIQQEFQCCGFNDVTDRVLNMGICQQINVFSASSAKENSSITDNKGDSNELDGVYAVNDNAQTVYGCKDALATFKKNVLRGMYIIAFTFTCFILVVVFMACILFINKI